MKKLKIILLIISVCAFSFISRAQSENSQSKSEKVTEEVTIACMCAGENLVGTVTWNHVVNNNKEHWNVQFGEMTGQTTQDKYRFVYVESIGNLVIFRVIGKDGLLTHMQWNAVTGEYTFYCTWWPK
ncbi:hypothetical protein [uncultured Draconibacterium sp.]|uniref:hypothetical protein n=1 Tax=uncultured Draconibacterium sp. TaxID=1573823 RepID=UPI0029C77BAC|nr:hypothetical protein [uncultured Draconibacterium sp.]